MFKVEATSPQSGKRGHRIDDGARFGYPGHGKTAQPAMLVNRSLAVSEVDAEGLVSRDV